MVTAIDRQDQRKQQMILKMIKKMLPMHKTQETALENNPDTFLDNPLDISSISQHRPTKVRIRICIPQEYSGVPIISRLVSHHEVTINISAASLETNSCKEGWFDLEIEGSNPQIQSALTYLDEMDIEIINKTDPEEDGW